MSRLTVTVVDGFGFEAEVELTFRRDVVDVHYSGLCRAVFDRDRLREWLTYPQDRLRADDVSLTLSTDGILLRIWPLIPGWPLSQSDLMRLRNCLQIF